MQSKPAKDVDPLEGNREIEDYEDFIDVSRRVHTKLLANLAESLTNSEKRVREHLGLPPRDADRMAARLPAPSDFLLDMGKLHLEYVDRLAELAKHHGTDVERALEGLMSHLPRSTARASRFEVDAYDPGAGKPYEPSTRKIQFRIRTDDLQPDTRIEVKCGRFVDVETGEAVSEAGKDALKPSAIDRIERGAFAPDRDATITLTVSRDVFRPSHAYSADVQLLVDGAVRRKFQVFLRILPKPALPLLELRWSHQANRWESRSFPITNDLPIRGDERAELEIKPVDGPLGPAGKGNKGNQEIKLLALLDPMTWEPGPKVEVICDRQRLAAGETALCQFVADKIPKNKAGYEAVVRLVLRSNGREEEVARLRVRAHDDDVKPAKASQAKESQAKEAQAKKAQAKKAQAKAAKAAEAPVSKVKKPRGAKASPKTGRK
jgi:hypothetical protein